MIVHNFFSAQGPFNTQDEDGHLMSTVQCHIIPYCTEYSTVPFNHISLLL